MDFFEQQPLLLILVIIVTVEGWTAFKTFVKKAWPQLGKKLSQMRNSGEDS
jgi:hypothetical protein